MRERESHAGTQDATDLELCLAASPTLAQQQWQWTGMYVCPACPPAQLGHILSRGGKRRGRGREEGEAGHTHSVVRPPTNTGSYTTSQQ